ncbi:MAG: hypothetical protein WA979_02135 [Pacificimonas sp.]
MTRFSKPLLTAAALAILPLAGSALAMQAAPQAQTMPEGLSSKDMKTWTKANKKELKAMSRHERSASDLSDANRDVAKARKKLEDAQDDLEEARKDLAKVEKKRADYQEDIADAKAAKAKIAMRATASR